MGMIASGLLVAYLLQAVLTYGQNFLMAVLGQRLAIDVILGYVRHLYELPMSFFQLGGPERLCRGLRMPIKLLTRWRIRL